MAAIDFNAFSIALKAMIESKNEFNKTAFRKICHKFISHSEVDRFFEALLKQKYIMNTKNANYAFVVAPGVMTRNELVNFFDRFKIRKPRRLSVEGRKAISNAAKARWANVGRDITSFTVEELKAELSRRDKEAKKAVLSNILANAGMSCQELLELIQEVQ